MAFVANGAGRVMQAIAEKRHGGFGSRGRGSTMADSRFYRAHVKGEVEGDEGCAAVGDPDDPTCLDDLCGRLRRDEITRLRLGWRDSDFLHGRRSMFLFEKAFKQNRSVTSVSIGWRLRHGPTLVKTLHLLARHPTAVTDFEVVMVDKWVPEETLRALLQRHTNLRNISLRSVSVARKNHQGEMCCAESARKLGGTPPSTMPSCCDHSVASRIIAVHMLSHEHLKELKLIDCGLTCDAAVQLADFLHIRGGISVLSLRGNRTLRSHGLRVLCQAPVIDFLDLSLCDMDPVCSLAVAQAVAARPWAMGHLSLAGNYRMETPALLAITNQAVCDRVLHLDISYCDVGDYSGLKILRGLAKLDKSTTLLREISMRGARISATTETATALTDLLAANNSLRILRANDPASPKNLSVQQLQGISEALRHNYELEVLEVDFDNSEKARMVLDCMNFHLRLNRAGRRILRPWDNHRPRPPMLPSLGGGGGGGGNSGGGNSSSRRIAAVAGGGSTVSSSASSFQHALPYCAPSLRVEKDWCEVLETAGTEGMDVLYWIVRRSADRF